MTRVCEIRGCGRKHIARGWCHAHYKRWQIYGDPLGGGPPTARNGEPLSWLEGHSKHGGEECLIWPYGGRADGYGSVWFRDRTDCAHRVMCILSHGDPPTAKHHAAHSCGNGHQGCVNPKHIRWATAWENGQDRIAHGRSGRGESSGSAKLTEIQVFEIRRRAASGRESQAQIGRDYGVGEDAIGDIHRRTNWGWL